jgi:hypothetical protein
MQEKRINEPKLSYPPSDDRRQQSIFRQEDLLFPVQIASNKQHPELLVGAEKRKTAAYHHKLRQTLQNHLLLWSCLLLLYSALSGKGFGNSLCTISLSIFMLNLLSLNG